MKIPQFDTLGRNPPPKSEDPRWRWAKVSFASHLQKIIFIIQAVNGNLTYGTGLYPDNIAGKWIDYTTNAVADTEDAVEHNLGVVPVGFHLMVPPPSGVINKGSTAWTTTHIYLKCSAAAQTARLFVLPPPRT
jgi:hypothetical protein